MPPSMLSSEALPRLDVRGRAPEINSQKVISKHIKIIGSGLILSCAFWIVLEASTRSMTEELMIQTSTPQLGR